MTLFEQTLKFRRAIINLAAACDDLFFESLCRWLSRGHGILVLWWACRRHDLHFNLFSVLFSAYTTPSTRAADALIDATIWNADIVDNIIALKNPPTDSHVLDEGADYTTTQTSFVDVDATNLALTINTAGGDVLVHFHGVFVSSGNYRIYVDVDVDGAREGTDDGIIYGAGTVVFALNFTRLITGLSVGAHTFKLQWKTSAGTATLYGGGTADKDVHGQFWAREIS